MRQAGEHQDKSSFVCELEHLLEAKQSGGIQSCHVGEIEHDESRRK